jgi:hypothetical protein
MAVFPVGAELFHSDGQTERLTEGQTDRQTDRQTDMTKVIVAFRNFGNALKTNFCVLSSKR